MSANQLFQHFRLGLIVIGGGYQPLIEQGFELRQARLAQLKALLDQGLITAEDYEKAKAEVLKQLIG